MRYSLGLYLILLVCSADAQLPLTFEGLVGVRLNILAHQDRPDEGNFLITSPLAGLKVSHRKYPFALTFMHDRSYIVRPYPINDVSDVQEIDEGSLLRVQYRGQRVLYGAGHYWYGQNGYIDFVFTRRSKTIRYVAFMIAFPVGRAEIEFQSLLRYTIFDVGDRYLQEINFKYHFGSAKQIKKSYPSRLLSLHFGLGGRWFLPDQEYLVGERRAAIGTAAAISTEVRVDRWRTGLFWQKDWWVAINAGSPQRLFKGLITNNVFGLKYHHPLTERSSLNLALGAAWIMDISTLDQTRNRILNGELSRKFWNNNIRGISIAPSFNVNPQLEVELRQIIATRGEQGLNLERLSLGVFYKIKP